MINRILIVIFASLFLAACGGGGGGGGGATANNAGSDSNTGGDDSSDQGNEQEEEQAFTQRQNEYLPLIEGSGWIYSIGEEEATILASVYDASSGLFELASEIEINEQVGTISQIFASNTESVSVKRFQASNFSFDLNNSVAVTFNYLEFNDAIAVIGDSLPTGSVNGILNIDADIDFIGPVNNVSINVVATPVVLTNAENTSIQTTWGTMQGVDMEVALRIQGAALGYTIDLIVTEESQFVKGVGPVSRDISFYLTNIATGEAGEFLAGVAMNIADLSGLPQPLIYSYDGVNLTQPESTLIRQKSGVASYTPLNAANYEILNESVFDGLAWASVEESLNGTVFEVDVVLPDPVPSSTQTEVIYLSETGSEDQIPVSVTLSID